MKITREIIEDALVNYGYDEIARVSEVKFGLAIDFPVDYDTSMDFIYSLSGIVQEIINKAYYAYRFNLYDMPTISISEDVVRVAFMNTIFSQYD